MKKGMSREAAHSRAATMATLDRSVRTATGTSTETYQHDSGMPSLPGEGQGKADSMAIWTLISSELLTMHYGLCHGVELVDVTGEISSRELMMPMWMILTHTQSLLIPTLRRRLSQTWRSTPKFGRYW